MYFFPERIDVDPGILGGKPVIKGTRIPVYIVLQMLRDGATFDRILKEYPRLSLEDIRAVLDYSLFLLNREDEEEIFLVNE